MYTFYKSQILSCMLSSNLFSLFSLFSSIELLYIKKKNTYTSLHRYEKKLTACNSGLKIIFEKTLKNIYVALNNTSFDSFCVEIGLLLKPP